MTAPAAPCHLPDRRAGTHIVNRELADWIALSDDEEVRLPDLPAESKPGPLVKDFTGYIVSRG